jgi:hypothetical protein
MIDCIAMATKKSHNRLDRPGGGGGNSQSRRSMINGSVRENSRNKKVAEQPVRDPKSLARADALITIGGIMSPRTVFSVTLAAAFIVFLTGSSASGQLAPAGGVSIQGSPGEYYLFSSEGTFTYGSNFTYINYATKEFDSILTNLATNGTFSGQSPTTGRVITGQVTTTSITLTYNGVTKSGTKISVYGPTRALAGNWLGLFADLSLGFGTAHVGISSQGGIVVVSYLGFGLDAGIGTIDSQGNFSVPLVGGATLTGTFVPSFGKALGSVNVSTGGTQNYALVRAVPSRVLNISTRGLVGSGEQVLIGGFIIGDGGKTVVIDAKGPSLAAAGVANPVQATQISLYSGSQVIASNNGWRSNANASEITASGLAPTDDRESALQVALEPGAYTVIVSSGDGSTGIGLVEVFGVGDAAGP